MRNLKKVSECCLLMAKLLCPLMCSGYMKRLMNVSMMRLMALMMGVLCASSGFAATPDIYDPTDWNRMKTALTNNNIEGALKYFHGASQDKYRKIFTLLKSKDELSAYASGMGEIGFAEVSDNLALYRIRRQETVKGVTYNISYDINFMKNPLGLWEIHGF